ncbi:MAG: LuxR C-terminal-related transcriptional regulator [Treponema sp.]|nr:LuxR C-terminal-related transcriptional regulator [Treponema sp.]
MTQSKNTYSEQDKNSHSVNPRYENSAKAHCSVNNSFHFKRARLNQLFMEAMKYPMIIVCAGAGYGKTTAVHDFLLDYQAKTVWVQLSERDNVGARFWENFTHCMTQINQPFAASLNKLGFPDTSEKISQYQIQLRSHANMKQRIFVFDDCHYIEDPSVIRFVEEAIRELPVGITIFLISRSTPRINIAGFISKDQIFNVSEDELRFTGSELTQYFRAQGISLTPDTLRAIMQDTEGWAFALNFVVRSYKKAPGYEGYLRNAMKTNIFKFMETEVWNNTSSSLQNFLVRLSLIDHLSVELLILLSGEEDDLVNELEKQSAYARRDNFINAFLIHPLFLEFLAGKQALLSPEQRRETYAIAGDWCNQNGFKIDALSYYEKIGDYNAIVKMFIGSPSQIPYDIACYAEGVLERAPREIFNTVTFLASTHLRTVICQGLLEKADELAAYYESKYINLPKNELFTRHTLGSIYYCWAITREMMCLKKDVYDFDLLFEKMSRLYDMPVEPGKLIAITPSPWICIVNSSRKGAPEDYINSVSRSGEHLKKCFINYDNGENDLARGEFMFYLGDINIAEHLIAKSLTIIRKIKKSALIHRALFYIIRIAVTQGNYLKAQKALDDMKTGLSDADYFSRFLDYDITLCWYCCALGMPDKAPDWLKENFSLYGYAGFAENYANQMKARYFYLTRNYPPLLSYIQDMKKRESFLYGRVEMLAIEACVYYKLKDKEKARALIEEAYETSSPNEIIMPYIELGKDMRTLTAFLLKQTCKIPVSWLEDISRKSTLYAKRLAHVITEYKRDNQLTDKVVISPRESEILMDLSHGLSRAEIAASRNLSINTVKMLVNNIYMKLGAENLADAIRIAAERKIV